MKNNLIILFSILLSGCITPISMLMVPDMNDAKWVHQESKQEVPNEIALECLHQASFKVAGREFRVGDDETLDKLDEIFRHKGKCLYEKGYVFKVEWFSIYCDHYSDLCDAYKEYRRYF